MTDFLRSFRAARRVSTPLVAVRTPDPAASIKGILESLKAETEEQNTPALLWDVCSGLTGLNPLGIDAANIANDGEDPGKVTARPSEMLRAAAKLPADSVVFMSNAHRFWSNEVVTQGVWNLRNSYKEEGRLLVLLTTLGAILPLELGNDVLVLDEPLPTVQDLDLIVKESFTNFGLPIPAREIADKATDALIGLAAFPAEQAAAMCMSKANGLDTALLWERKRQAIEQVKGLKVWRGEDTFSDLGGLTSLKNYLQRVLRGKKRVRLVVFLDELEKSFAGTGTDLSGTKTDMTGTFLTWMQDKRARGVMFIGHPGTGKSAVAKAMGNEAGVPTVMFDFSGMQASLVGESGANLRAALAVIDAMSQGGAFFVATSNNLAALPPELKRRFKRGTWFFDLPTAEERASLWKIYRVKHNISADDKEPPCDGWTGAEIESCCETADELEVNLHEAAEYIVPISRSSSEAIKQLCEFANNRFLSVSEPGTYRIQAPKAITGSGRRIRGEGAATI